MKKSKLQVCGVAVPQPAPHVRVRVLCDVTTQQVLALPIQLLMRVEDLRSAHGNSSDHRKAAEGHVSPQDRHTMF